MRTGEEEVVNAYTHFVWSVLSVVSLLIVLLNENLVLRGKIIFLFMISLSCWTFFSSFLYHSTQNPRKKERNRLVDKAAIYLMIVGCGTSISLTCYNSLAAAGSASFLILLGGFFTASLCIKRKTTEVFSVVSYVLLGWAAIFPALGLVGKTGYIETSSLWILILGGVAYSIGLGFYSRDTIKWNHTWWHVLVMVGFTLHLAACSRVLVLAY
jgi:hemolysin III